MKPLLSVRDLTVEFELTRGILKAVNGASLEVHKGEVMALVGESGSGKTTFAFSILNLVPPPGRITSGKIIFDGRDVLSLSEEELRKYRWKEVAMVFQAAQNAMNPVMRIADQMLDTAQAHGKTSRGEVLERASELLRMVHLEPSQVLHAYPHELSGGMRQRVIIALSLLLDPKMLILDEPTTALDVVTQAYILDILAEIRQKLGLAMLLLTHDMSIVAKVADRVAVMYAGKVVEVGNIEEIFYDAKHPYTVGLIKAAPSLIGDIADKRPIPGSPPDLINPPPGCPFHPRCDYATDRCREEVPVLTPIGDGRVVACHNWQQVHL
ncbi:MAG TPA: ABC transporter ATP-binding protein [Chloroflexi bacterium]|nr:ABC transporter ATP-binding protein [Chloroflexota bacterium]